MAAHGTTWIFGKGKYIISNSHVFGIRGTTVDVVPGNMEFLFESDVEKSIPISFGKLLKIGTRDVDEASNEDYAIAEIDAFDLKYSRIVDLVGGLALNTIDEENVINDTVFMPGYPGGTQRRISYYSDNDLSKRSSITGTVEQQVVTDAYATYGSSGSPIISANELTVLGMLWGGDDNGVNKGVKGSHIWDSIKAFTDVEENQNITGLAAQYDITAGMLSFVNNSDEEWHTLISYSDDIFFNEFSGTLTHLDGYTLFKCKALNHLNLDEYIINLTFRLAQNTESGLINLENSASGDKELLITYNADDNPEFVLRESYNYSMWVGLEAVLSGSNEISGYFIFQVGLQSI